MPKQDFSLIEEIYKAEIENYLHNVAWLRRHYGYSKKKMAKVLGIGVGSINKIEDGKMPPRLNAAVMINIYNHFGRYSEDMHIHK